jgi:hypothetical protein
VAVALVGCEGAAGAANVVHVDAGNRQVDVTALEGVFPVSWEQ